MKKIPALIILVFIFSFFNSACKKGNNSNGPDSDVTTIIPTGSKMKINIGSQIYRATLYENAAAAAFKALLPMTLDMADLNNNEKHFDLPRTLPVNSSNPGTIQTGDLMLYGSSTLVLFYKGFNTSFSYTRLARVDDISGLADALGSTNVRVTYQLD
ncbi:cyclophilin-like fold protein [Mucilaginibacter lappiensis]|uniref:Cyclophilin-like domain-containing protein n=1 Tax=Mucilaginibacter lappiensis TaxID=354630 RepID=A0A841JMK6_9SPHI|nr:cyclophilin-like fold protein [Mucilaginibacter lappiensis]MBB6130826.1 hypothetical protein [Mucilaginibacter lappiensis]